MMGAVRKNPRALAKAYRRIQSTKYHQVTQAEAEAVARAAIDAAKALPKEDEDGNKLGRVKRIKQETGSVLTNFIGIIGKEYESTLEARYVRYLRSTKALRSVVGQELAKPEYAGKLRRKATVARQAWRAVKEVY